MHRVLLTALLGFLALASASSRVMMETDIRFEKQDKGWKSLGRADPSAPLQVHVAVRQSHVAELEQRALRVSTPGHPLYGKHMTLTEVDELVAPAEESVRAVLEWLGSEGVPASAISSTGNMAWVTLNVTVAQAERLLGGVTYEVYEHDDDASRRIVRLGRGQHYSLPSDVAAVVDFVSPSCRFPRLQTGPVVREFDPDLAIFVTPQYLRQLYQWDGVLGSASVNNSQAIAGFIGQFWSQGDLTEFWKLFQNVSLGESIKQIGQNQASNPGLEASLDVQTITSVAPGVNTWVWYTADQNTPFDTWLRNVSAATEVPNLFSVSYGSYENSLTAAYAQRVSTEFAKLSARGVSVLVASGDSGAGGNCTGNSYSPDFPASVPWVTAVGGCIGGNVPANASEQTGEVADWISGGGFSTFFPRPSWQDAAVKKYLATAKLPNSTYFNSSGAAYPQLCAQSEMFTVVFDYLPVPGVGGTSCATPCVAAGIGLINDARIRKGMPPLGFLNPLIYQTATAHSDAFNDITSGFNLGCDWGGFNAAPGWDPVTGWGSLKGVNLLKYWTESS